MSDPRPTPHTEKSTVTTDKLHRQDSETSAESSLEMTSPKKRESDMLDGMQSTADAIDKLLLLVHDLMFRMRQVEASTEAYAESKRSSGGCGLNCANNSLNM